MQISPERVSEAYFSSSSQQSSSLHAGMQQEASNGPQTITKSEDEAFGGGGQTHVPYGPMDDPDFTLPGDASGGEKVQKILSRVKRVIDSLGRGYLLDGDNNFESPTPTFKRPDAGKQVSDSRYSGRPVRLSPNTFLNRFWSFVLHRGKQINP